jgi:hypothetical protein
MIPMISAVPGAIAGRLTYKIVKANGGSETNAIVASSVVGGTLSVFMLDPVGGAGFYAMTHLTTHATTEAATQIAAQVTTQDVAVQLVHTAVIATMDKIELVNCAFRDFGNYGV